MRKKNTQLREYLKRGYRTLLPLVYARTNYKLFLQRSVEELDDTIRSLLCTSDALSGVIRPIPIKAPFGDSMLVIAPHQDDEVIGCGGAMLLQRKKKKDLYVVFVHEGADEYRELGYARKELAKVREKEAAEVAEEIGIIAPRFLRHPVFNESEIATVAKQLKEEIKKTHAHSIFVPFFLDYNPDHRMTNYALAEALEGLTEGRKIYGYEVWGLCIPNVVLNIDSVMARKQKLISFYKSQLQGTDYVNWVTGLNMYHSRSLGAGACKYAERFFEIPAEDYVQLINKLRKASRSEQ